MPKQTINTDQAPAPIGPYEQAIQFDQLIFTSGQIPLSIAGEVVGKSIQDQTKQVMLNLQAVLETAGSSLQHIVKVTVFLADMNDFPEFNSFYAEFFEENCAPARSTVEVSRLPKDVLVEIEAVAVKA